MGNPTLFLLLLLSCLTWHTSYSFTSRTIPTSPRRTELRLLPPEASSLLIATIDSDIAKLSDNEFAPIFLGGIGVMLGGLVSAIVVGTMVDKGNLSVQLVADLYDDAELWKGLSEEEKMKAQKMLQEMQEGESGGAVTSLPAVAADSETIDSPSPVATTPAATSPASPTPVTGSSKKDMFDDY